VSKKRRSERSGNRRGSAGSKRSIAVNPKRRDGGDGGNPGRVAENYRHYEATSPMRRNATGPNILGPLVRNLLVLQGGMTPRARREITARLARIPDDEPRLVLATGRYIGSAKASTTHGSTPCSSRCPCPGRAPWSSTPVGSTGSTPARRRCASTTTSIARCHSSCGCSRNNSEATAPSAMRAMPRPSRTTRSLTDRRPICRSTRRGESAIR
jgi:hypothetical protein